MPATARSRVLLTVLAGGLLLCSGADSARASVHDIHLHSDSAPDYVSIDDIVATVTSGWTDPEDQALAFWRWMTRTHLQDSATFEDGAPVWDPARFYASYPNSFCGYMAAYLTAFADRMGGDWRHRYIELADHTVCELSWDAGATWHMFDPSMVVYARRHDGQIASCADIAAADACALSSLWGAAGAEPGHLYFYHLADEAMTNPPDPDQTGDWGYPSGYRKAVENPVPFARTLRNGAYSYWAGFTVQEEFTHVRTGWRNRLHLRPGHEYTRYDDPLGSGPEYARLTTQGDDPNVSEFPANIRSNGLWEVEPGFASADPAQGWHELDGIVHRDSDGGGGPALRPAAGQASAHAVVKVDASNVLTSARVWWAGTRGGGDAVSLQYSRDAGCTWVPVASAPSGAFAAWHDLTSAQVGGAHELLVRAVLAPDATRTDCGLDDLRVEAVTQLNRLALPRLQRGTNTVRFAAGPAVETLTLRPTLHQGAEHHWSVSAAAYAGLASGTEAQTYSTAALRPAQAGVPGFVTWRFDTPTDITAARIGGSFLARLAGAGDRVTLRWSWDSSEWFDAAVFDAGTVSTWDGRLVGDVAAVPPGRRTVYLQMEAVSSVTPSSLSTGAQELLLEVQHAPHDAAFAPVEVTWAWTEHRTTGDVAREHTRVVTTPTGEVWQINVDGYRDPTLRWIRTRLADGTSPVPGYSDGVDVGPVANWDKVRISGAWLDDVALRRPYTVSRPAAALNPDTGGTELTDGTVIPPTDYTTSYFVQGQAAYWEGDAPLAVTVDLGGPQTVAAVRVTSHQPTAQFGHAGTISVSGLNGGVPTALGVIQHDDVWNPPGDHLDWGYERSEQFDALPAGGRLAHGFWLVLDQPVTAEEIKLDILPLAGHGVGLSEIQVYSAVTVEDWPDREIVLGDGVTSVPDERDGGPAVRRPYLRVGPNPANPATFVHYDLPAAATVRLRVVDVRGRLVRTLVDGWRPGGAHRAFWDGRDDGGRSMASGVYLVVGEWGGVTTTGRVTLVR